MTTARRRAKYIISMAIFGTLSIFVRNIDLPSAELAMWRGILGSALLSAFLLAKRGFPRFSDIRRELPLLLLSGAAMGGNWMLLFEAYKYTTVSAATLSYYFSPTIITVLSPLLFREKITAKQLVCFILSTLGVLLVIGLNNLTKGGSDLIGICFGLGAAALYASVVLINKFIKGVSGINRTLFQLTAAFIVLLPYTALTSGFHIGSLSGFGWTNLLVVGLFHTGFTYCMFFSAMSGLPGQEAAILSYIDPLVAVIISVTVLGETILPMQLVGGALILGFAIFNELPDKGHLTSKKQSV